MKTFLNYLVTFLTYATLLSLWSYRVLSPEPDPRIVSVSIALLVAWMIICGLVIGFYCIAVIFTTYSYSKIKDEPVEDFSTPEFKEKILQVFKLDRVKGKSIITFLAMACMFALGIVVAASGYIFASVVIFAYWFVSLFSNALHKTNMATLREIIKKHPNEFPASEFLK